jgi:hypothetical protein
MYNLPQSAPATGIIRRHHLLSPVHDLAFLSLDLPWRAFTLSSPLQAGIWLLRRLCPLSRTLAFWRPLQGERYQSSLIPTEEVIASRSDLLYAGGSSRSSPQVSVQYLRQPPYHFGHGVSASFAILFSRRLRRYPSTQVSLVRIGGRACDRSAGLARRLAPLSVGIPPQAVPLPDAGHSALMSLLSHRSLSNSFSR